MPLVSKNVINMTLNFNFDCPAFFGLGKVGLFHWELWCLVSEPYSKAHVSSLVIDSSTQVWFMLKTLNDVLTHLHAAPLLPIISSLGTIFAQTFCMPKSSVIIFQTLFFFMSSGLAIILTVYRRSPRTICFTGLTFTSVLLVEDLPLLESSSIFPHPSLNLLCHSKAQVRYIALSPYTCLSISSACDGVYLKWTKNFRLVLC